MNIDWNEISKGLEEELQKTALEKEAVWGSELLPGLLRGAKALGPLLARGGNAVVGGARAAAPYVASGIENTGAALGRAGDTLNAGARAAAPYVASGIEGAGRVAGTLGDKLNAGVKGVGQFAAPYAAEAIEGTGNFLGRHSGKLTAGAGLGGSMLGAAAMEKVAPETHKAMLNDDGWLSLPHRIGDKALGLYRGTKDLLGMGGDAIHGVSQVGSDLINAVTPTASQAASDGSTSGNIHSAREGVKSLWDTITGVTGKIRSGADQLKNTVSNLYDTGTKGLNDYFGGMGDMGKYIPAIGGLLAGGIGAYLLNRKKPTQGGYGYGGMPAININVGGMQGRGMPPGFLNNDPTQVQSLGSYKQGSLLKGADMVDALSSAVGRRMADKVLNSAAGPGKPATQREEHPKELEITSKHPHMSKLLKNKKNKEYLENLLKE